MYDAVTTLLGRSGLMWYRELLLAHNITVKGIGQQKNICFSLGFQSDEFLRLYF